MLLKKTLRATAMRILIFTPFVLASLAHAALQVHVTFDENVGGDAFNTGLSGSVNDAPLNTGNSRVAGQLGGGLSFNNTTSSSIVAGANPIPADTLRTISFWLNTTASGGGLDTYLSFGINNNPDTPTAPGTKFDLSVDNNTGHLEVGVGGGRTDSGAASVATAPVNDGVWRLATFTIPDLDDDEVGVADLSDIDMYVDGVFSYDGSSNTAADRTISTNANGFFYLGRRANDDAGESVNGSIDDVAVWDEPLTPDEIKGLFDVGSSLGVNAGIYDQVLGLHDAGAGTIFAGDFEWSFASGLMTSAGVTGSSLVLDDAANTGVTFTALVPGDVDRNGLVELADFTIIQTNFFDSATSRDDGDLNGDGIVDFGDFRIWKDAADAAVAASVATVPEPAAGLLLAGLALPLVVRRRRLVIACLLLACFFGAADRASAQATNVYFIPTTGPYNSDASWDSGFQPEAFLDEIAVIGANTNDAVLVGAAETATATLNAAALQPAAVILGNGIGSTGTLDVQTGGSLTIPGTLTVSTGLQVGQGENGRGFLNIAPGASVATEVLNLNGQTDGLPESQWSAISLSGDASLTTTVGVMNLNRVINVTGPDATIESAGDISLGGRGRYFANITGATHSVMRAAGNFQFNGVLIPTFSGTASPVEGASWDLFDSATTGANLEVRFDDRVPGQGFVIEQRPGGNGVITSLAVRSTLVLDVNRDTGEVQITQPFGSPISFDGYSISSPAGNLGSSSWTSLDAQNVADWTEANATANFLNELKPTTSTQVSGSGFSLGTAYTPDFSIFGQAIDEDLSFTYFDNTTGQLVQGDVVYSGVKVNDLVLLVDADTGQAQLRNTSDASVSIDGYQISSASGSLTTGGWVSLEDQASADWFEAEESSTALAELLPAGIETLAGDSGFNLGAIFSTGGTEDLMIDYFQAGANVLQAGQVLYVDELPALDAGLAGDYDDDGMVSAADFAVWRSGGPLANESATPGVVDAADYDEWAANFGSGAGAAVAAATVPEPTTGFLGLIAMSFLAWARRVRPARVVVRPAVSLQRLPLAGIAAAVAMLATVHPATAQTILFDHNFENAPNPGTAVTSVADLGAPAAGSLSFSGSPIGGIGGTRPALAVGFNGNTAIANMSEPTENNVTYNAIVDSANFSFPETQTADAGSGDLVFAEFGTPGAITSTSQSTDISFAFGQFGNANTGGFKHSYIRGLDDVGNEVFELLFVSGSAANTRQWYARGPSDDSTELTAANMGTPEGQLLASGFSAFNSTNVANGRPAGAFLVDIGLSNSMVTFDITSTDGSGTPTAVNGMALPINSGATTIDRLEFSTLWNASVNGQNNGYWVDDLFAITNPIGSFPDGDVNLDGLVDIADFNIIADNFLESASSRSQGDLNDDGFVDFTDFRIWKDVTSSPATAALVIPEPGAAMLLALGAVGVGLRRRR